MRRTLSLLFVLMLCLPAVATAQEATPGTAGSLEELLPSGETLGEGWSCSNRISGENPALGFTSAEANYGGPAGARIAIGFYQMPTGFSSRAAAWEKIRSQTLDKWVIGYGASLLSDPSRLTDTSKVSADLLPSPIGDNLVYRFAASVWLQPAIAGLFEITDGPTLFVAIDGTVDGDWPDYRSLADVVTKTLASNKSCSPVQGEYDYADLG